MMRAKRSAMNAEIAEALAARALLFIAEDERRLIRFLGDTGLDPATLGTQMKDRSLLASVLAHLLADESQLLVFTAAASVDPTEVMRAQMLLEGPRE